MFWEKLLTLIIILKFWIQCCREYCETVQIPSLRSQFMRIKRLRPFTSSSLNRELPSATEN